MKKIVLMTLMISGLTAFTVIPEGVKELAGYKLRDNAISLKDYNLWAITSQPAFDKTFIAEDPAAARPHFTTEMVLAAKVETLVNTYMVKFRRMDIKGEDLDVYFNVQREGTKLDKSSQVSLVTLPKDRRIKKVNFYHDNILVRTIPIVTVY